jgi:dipeptidyl aminopeptidase/acylaminoacyl peptidase
LNQHGEFHENEIFTTEGRIEFVQGEYPHGELEDCKPIQEQQILLHYNRNGYSEFWIYSTKEEKVVRLEPSSKELKGGFWAKSFIVSGKNLFIVLSSPSMSDQIWRINLDTREETLLTKAPLNLEVQSQSTKMDLLNDGVESQWYEHTPTGGSQGTVLFLHGGPAVQSRFEWKREVASFLSRGMRVIVFNPRGGLGRGAKFAALDDYHPGDGSNPRRVKVIDETKHLIRLEKKWCLYGGSYGGWLVHKILADEEDLGIVAAGTRNGIFNIGTLLDKTAPWRKSHREAEYGPMKMFQNDGPLSCLNVSRFIHPIPLKIVVGAADARVPVGQSVEFIKEDGGRSDCSMLVYAKEGHKIKRLDNRIESIRWIVDLFHSC